MTQAPPRADAKAPETRRVGVPRRLLALVRNTWRTLTSMGTALVLLFLLALGAIPGALLPQRSLNSSKVDEYLTKHSTIGPWLDRVQAFDVFSSFWFTAIYVLLFISLVGCVTPRLCQAAAASQRAARLTRRLRPRVVAVSQPAQEFRIVVGADDTGLGSVRCHPRQPPADVDQTPQHKQQEQVRHSRNLLYLNIRVVGRLGLCQQVVRRPAWLSMYWSMSRPGSRSSRC